ncbi:MAG: hypothetical protein RJB13_259 [Pseudomonadota bacterium]
MQISRFLPLLVALFGFNQTLSAQSTSNYYLVQNTSTSPTTGAEVESLSVLKGQGIILDDDLPHEGALFLIDYTHTANNGKPVSTVIRQTDKAGNVLVVEETVYNSQGKFNRYSIQQNQIDANGIVEKVGDAVRLTWNDSESQTVNSEAGGDNLVTSGSLLAYMNTFIDELKSGKTLEVNLAIPERGSCYSFDIHPRMNAKSSAVTDLGVTISLSNFFLRKLITPIKMTFQNSPEGYRPLSIVAPAAVRKKVGNTLQKFTARIEYPRQ